MEHIGKAGALVRFPCIPTVHGLVYVPLQVLHAHEVVDTKYHTLEVTPEPLDGVCRDAIAVTEHLKAVLDNVVEVTLLGQTFV